jgi:HlyD family secretion protein
MNSTVVQNVVTYDTIVDFNNPDLKLFPGMTAYVTIPVATAANAVKVPNGALRYKPDIPADEVRTLYQKYGIAETGSSGPPAKGGAGRAAGAKGSSSGENQGGRSETQIVWKLLPDKSLEPVKIKTGITDHTFTELVQEIAGNLKDGDDLITGLAQGRSSGSSAPRGPAATKGR